MSKDGSAAHCSKNYTFFDDIMTYLKLPSHCYLKWHSHKIINYTQSLPDRPPYKPNHVNHRRKQLAFIYCQGIHYSKIEKDSCINKKQLAIKDYYNDFPKRDSKAN